MITKNSLTRGVAAGVLIAVAAGAGAAQAAPAKHHHHGHHHASMGESSGLVEEVMELRNEVTALKAAMAQQAAANQQAQAAAAAAQEQAQAAQAQVRASSDDIKRIPGVVEKDVMAHMPAPKPSWADTTQVHGVVFANLSNIDQHTQANGSPLPPRVRQAPSGTGFDIKRMYIGIDHKFNDIYSANLTTDFQMANVVSAAGGSNLQATELYIKKAYLQAKYSDALTIRAGAADLPWVPFVEDLYGYRYVENTLIDRTKFGTSADWGLNANGKLANGMLNYSVSVINGAGYKVPGTGGANPTLGRTQKMDIEGRLSANFDHFVFGIGGYQGYLGKDPVGAVTHHTASRFDAVAAYVSPTLRAGVEYYSANNWNTVTSVVGDKANGTALWGSYKFADQFAAFGRYDWVNATTGSPAVKKKDNYYNLGLTYSPAKIVDISLVYKKDSVKNGTFSTSNGTIGGAHLGDYDEIGLFAQYRW
jgi:hypothetical protein